MSANLENKAIKNLETKRKKKRSMQIIGVIFGSAATLLSVISLFMNQYDRPYMMIPIVILALVYLIIYTAVIGLPFTEEEEIDDDAIEKEMANLYRQSKKDGLLAYNEEERLELKELDDMRMELGENEDYV